MNLKILEDSTWCFISESLKKVSRTLDILFLKEFESVLGISTVVSLKYMNESSGLVFHIEKFEKTSGTPKILFLKKIETNFGLPC